MTLTPQELNTPTISSFLSPINNPGQDKERPLGVPTKALGQKVGETVTQYPDGLSEYTKKLYSGTTRVTETFPLPVWEGGSEESIPCQLIL